MKQNTLVFSSELKGLLSFPGVEAVIDREGLCEVFGLGPAKTYGKGVFKNVKELLPGHFLEFHDGILRTECYWHLESHPHEDSWEQTVEKTRYLVTDAIKLQMLSDVPICCYFQPVGEGAIQIEPDTSFLTGIGQAFSLMCAHKGGNLCEINGMNQYEAAATVRDTFLTVTLVNTDQDSEKEFCIDCSKLLSNAGADHLSLAKTHLLTPDSLLPHSRFSASELEVSVEGASLTAVLAPCSIAKICLQFPT